jgi:site-specific DNA-methyltransferase (adenine-specific)
MQYSNRIVLTTKIERDLTISQDDAVNFLLNLPDESIDLVITDPPYESLEKHRKIGTTTRLKKSKSSSNEWFEIFPNSRFEELFEQVYRVLKNNTHFYLMCDQETAFIVKPIAEKCGFKFWKPIIWDKMKIGMGYHYRARYEFILFFEKGKKKLNDLSVPDVLAIPRVYRGYPTEKPVPLMDILIKQSTIETEIVCDPFMGSGSVGVSAITLNRAFYGNDLSTSSIEHVANRLAEVDKAAEN